MIRIRKKAVKIGNSIAVIIPKVVADALKIDENSYVDLLVNENKVIMKKVRR